MKFNSQSILKIASALVVVMAMSACSSHRKTATGATVPAPVAATPRQAMTEMVEAYTPAWQRVKMSVNVNITAPTPISASGQLTMERGRCVVLSMRVLGMEVASLMLTSSDITVVDRWNKRYLREDLSQFLAGFPVDINNVQDILLGRLFEPGKPELTVADISAFRFEEGDNGTWACTTDGAPGRKYDYAFVAVATTLAALHAQAGGGNAQINYYYPVVTPFGPIASELNLNVATAKKDIALSIKTKPEKASWDGDVSSPSLNLPSGYERIDASKLLNKLGK